MKRVLNPPPTPPVLPTLNCRLTPSQLEEAIRTQRQTGERNITDILIELNMVGERERLMALAQERGMAFVDLDRIKPDPAALKLIWSKGAREYRAIPIKKHGSKVWVAMADTTNRDAIDDLRIMTGLQVIPVMAHFDDLDAIIRRFYPDPPPRPEGTDEIGPKAIYIGYGGDE